MKFWSPWVCAILVAAAAVATALAAQTALEEEISDPPDDFSDEEDSGGGDLDDVGFEDDESGGEGGGSNGAGAGAAAAAAGAAPSEQEVLKALANAMRRPGMRKKLGQVLPILRSMSPAQRLALASLLAARLANGGAGAGTGGGGEGGVAAAALGLDAEQREQLLLPLSQDIANMFEPEPDTDEPEAQELRQLPRGSLESSGRSSRPPAGRRNGMGHRPSGPPMKRMHPKRARPPPPPPHRRGPASKPQRRLPPNAGPKRGDVVARAPPPGSSGPSPPLGPAPPHGPADPGCEYFTNTLCLEVADYPNDAIMASIQRHKGALQALLAEYPAQRGEESAPAHRALTRREDPAAGGGAGAALPGGGALCSSVVKYARPKRARATSGHWKYVVNVGDYTQTLRLEMCSKPNDACAFVSDNFRSSCSQVFNYHRLLTWDDTRGLHMDIFKVPSCCSCRVHGYAFNFPPPTRPGSGGGGVHTGEHFPGHGAFDAHHGGGGGGAGGGLGGGSLLDHLDGDDFNPDAPAGGGAGFGHDLSFHGGFQDNDFGHDGAGGFHGGGFDDSGGFGRPLGSSSSFQETTLFHGADRPVHGSTRRGPRPAPPLPSLTHQNPHAPHGPLGPHGAPGAFRQPPPLPSAGGVGVLAPPPGPPLPLSTGAGVDADESFPPFAPQGNLIRRSRNQTQGPRFEQDLAVGASAPIPPPRRPAPVIITSDVFRTTTARPPPPPHPAPLPPPHLQPQPPATRLPPPTRPPPPVRPSPPTRPPPPPTRPPPPPTRPPPPPSPPTRPPAHSSTPLAIPVGSASASDTKRINYSYHPIIDFFQSQPDPGASSRLEQRKGEEWTPIVGDQAKALAAQTTR